MEPQRRFTATLLAVVILALSAFEPFLSAQNTPLSPLQLEQLLSPIGLYPDSLLSQIMTASTNPQEILDVDNWLHDNGGLTGAALTDAAQAQGFDPAFIALVAFPQVLGMMAENVDDYAAIGDAFTADQASVMQAIQRLRAQAYNAGSLRTNAQQTVQLEQEGPQIVYVIQPANPQVVYVPQYDPTVVYAGPSTGDIVAASLITFGAGIGIGYLIASNQPWGWGGWGWNWHSHRVYYNHGYWGGWPRPYHPPNPWYRPRPIIWTGRPGYGGNWHYRPPNYYPPHPGNRPGGRPPWGPTNPPSGGRPPGNRPPVNHPGGGKPGHNPPPSTRPPGGNNPGGSKPGQPNPPSTRPPGGNYPGGGKPVETRPPSNRPPGNQPPANRPPGNNPGGNRPPQATPQPRPQPKPAQPATRPAPNYKPNPNAGYSKGPGNTNTGGRTSAFGGGNHTSSDRAAVNRGKASVASQQKQQGGGRRK